MQKMSKKFCVQIVCSDSVWVANVILSTGLKHVDWLDCSLWGSCVADVSTAQYCHVITTLVYTLQLYRHVIVFC